MLTLVLEADTEQRVAERARKQGVSTAELIRAWIEDCLDDQDDIQMAVERLDNPMQPLTAIEARKALGLDD